MLEIPESYNIAAQLEQSIKDKQIVHTAVDTSPHKFAFYNQEPDEYDALLTDNSVDAVKAYAGYVEMELGDLRLLLGDGINLRWLPAGSKVPQKHQLYMEFADGSSLICTISMYGSIFLFKDGEYDNPYYLVAKEKPNPLTDGFDRNYFQQLFDSAKPTLSAKAFLATEQRIPGLGNGVLQDILFNARIHPKRKINTLSADDLDKLFESVKNTLADMTAKGGRSTEKNLFGEKGGYSTILSSKTLQEPCPICGGFITKQAYLGGSIYFCPVCQPL